MALYKLQILGCYFSKRISLGKSMHNSHIMVSTILQLPFLSLVLNDAYSTNTQCAYHHFRSKAKLFSSSSVLAV